MDADDKFTLILWGLFISMVGIVLLSYVVSKHLEVDTCLRTSHPALECAQFKR